MQKVRLCIPSVHSSNKVNFRIPSPDVTPIFDHAQPKHFQSSFNLREIAPALATHIFNHDPPKTFQSACNFVNLYQHAKNEAVSSICSGEMLDLKILQSEWLRALWPICQEQNFSQTEGLYRNTVSNTNFHYRKKFSFK